MGKKRDQATLSMTVQVSLHDIDFFSLTRDELFNFITAIDDRVAEYEFTERLRDHFSSVLAREDEVAKASPWVPKAST